MVFHRNEEGQMIRVCCYCNANLGEKEPLEDKRVTHSVCPSCYEKEVQKMRENSPEVQVDEEMASVIFTCGCTYGKGRYISKCWRHADEPRY